MRKLTDEQKRQRGTFQPHRSIVSLYPDHASRPDPAEIPAPQGMTPEGAAIWKTKVDRYKQRGQKVGGFEEALRNYCELEARLLAAWNDGDGPSMAMVATYRMWAGEFYDTPASQKINIGSTKSENPFAKFGS